VTSSPNLFIVGAPKCGTTALYSYLRNHPDVFMSELKEPQFFASDTFGEQRNVTTLPKYLEYFAGANNQKKVGEASTCYLGSRAAAEGIKTLSPSAQIVLMLRNPVEVIYALHSERILNGTEHIGDFATALDSNEERRWRRGKFKGKRVIRPTYRELSRYVQPVRRYFDTFGRENVHVIIYDDFRQNTKAAFGELLAFLGVGSSPEIEYSIMNANHRVRSMVVQDFLAQPPECLRRFSRAVVPKQLRHSVMRTVRSINAVYAPRPAMNPQLRMRLQSECRRDIDELSQLLNRDLSHWCGSERRNKKRT
jgi:hypothetical protein